MEQQDYPRGRIEELRRQVAYAERVKQVMNRIHAATDLDEIFVELLDEILSLFDAEHLTLYAVDYDKKEIYSRVGTWSACYVSESSRLLYAPWVGLWRGCCEN